MCGCLGSARPTPATEYGVITKRVATLPAELHIGLRHFLRSLCMLLLLQRLLLRRLRLLLRLRLRLRRRLRWKRQAARTRTRRPRWARCKACRGWPGGHAGGHSARHGERAWRHALR